MVSFAESKAPQLQSVVDLVTPQLCRTDILGFEPVVATSDIDSLAAQIPTESDKLQLQRSSEPKTSVAQIFVEPAIISVQCSTDPESLV